MDQELLLLLAGGLDHRTTSTVRRGMFSGSCGGARPPASEPVHAREALLLPLLGCSCLYGVPLLPALLGCGSPPLLHSSL